MDLQNNETPSTSRVFALRNRTMTKTQLEAVYDELVATIGSTNHAAEDEESGPTNHMIVLSLHDDGSGGIGQRSPRSNEVQDWYDFNDFDGLILVCNDSGVEFEEGS
jgi:hypothetical protein